MLTLDFIVRRGASRTPDRVAVIEGDAQWTWRDFDAEVNRAAAALSELGVGTGDRVAAAGYNSAEYLALYYGAARLGAIICPLNYLCAEPELRYMIGDLEPTAVLAEAEFDDKVRAAAAAAAPEATVLSFNGGPDTDWAERLARADATVEFPPPDPESVHIVMYTSGTTGRPKGVCHTQRAHYLDGLNTALGYGLTPADRYVVHAPSFHAASWDHAKIFLIADGSIVITPKFDPVTLMEATARHRATVLFGVPAVLRMLLTHQRWDEFDLSSVRLVYFGGALGPLTILEEFAEAVNRPIDFVQIYGLTEGGPFATIAPPETVKAKPKSIGKPVPGVQLEIVDPETGERVPDGEVGEIVLRSATVMSGYWRNPEATAQALRDGWLHTGDLGVRDAEGDIEIVDRLKDMIRTGGENVYAAEVERVLVSHPAVVEAAVIGVPDERWDERVVAVVALREPNALDEAQLQEYCREHLARYKVPKEIRFTEDFPRTGVGKIAKPQLREWFTQEAGS
jgi:acyl-CoA synthetase (AMP-forming)/AMP-acid ligase II